MSPSSRPLRRAACFLAAGAALLLSACGGGGSGSASTSAVGSSLASSRYPSAASLANVCTVDGQKQWLRSYMDETYLWADQVPQVDPAATGTVADFFSALLVRTPDVSGQPTDRFSTTMTALQANALQGVTAAASPASVSTAVNPVPLVRTITSGTGRRVGYILFNDHSQGAQDALIDAVRNLQAQRVQELVLDLRYNSGGFLYVAQSAAAMVAGPQAEGQVFERFVYGARRTAAGAGEAYPFPGAVVVGESRYPAGTPLPQLDLPRLYVLTSQLTCSASESIVNALRGVGVQVVLVGDRTCGKPYGFRRKDNCGQAYFPIEFGLRNARDEGGYVGGLPVQCPVSENPQAALGAATEPLLAAALRHIDTGSCPTVARSTAWQAGQAGGLPAFGREGAPDPASPAYQPGFDGRQLTH